MKIEELLAIKEEALRLHMLLNKKYENKKSI